MSKLIDSFEKGFAVFVIALIFVQLLALFAKDVLKLEVPSFLLQLGIVFTFLAIGAVVVMIWTIVVNKGLAVQKDQYFGIILVIGLVFITAVFIPRILPSIYPQSYLDGLRGVGLFSAAPFDLSSLNVVTSTFNTIVRAITPLFSLVILLASSIYIHLQKKWKNGMKTFLLAVVVLLFVIIALTEAYAKTFGMTA